MSWKPQSTEYDAKISKIHENQTKKHFFLKKRFKNAQTKPRLFLLNEQAKKSKVLFNIHPMTTTSICYETGIWLLTKLTQLYKGQSDGSLIHFRRECKIYPTQKGKLVDSKGRMS